MEWAVLLFMMLLASVTTFHVAGHWYLPLAVAWATAFVWFGGVVGLTQAQMGLTNPIPGLLWGGACIAIVSLGMIAGVAVPRLHPLFADERTSGATGAEVAHKSLIELPFGTVMLEEIVFRSVVLGVLTVRFGTVAGVVGSSLLFGFWHILPALEMHGSHSLTSQLGAGLRAKAMTVVGTILATGAAGVGFAMLVVWSGSVLAPMGLHWATNSTGSIAAWFVARRLRRANSALADDTAADDAGADASVEGTRTADERPAPGAGGDSPAD